MGESNPMARCAKFYSLATSEALVLSVLILSNNAYHRIYQNNAPKKDGQFGYHLHWLTGFFLQHKSIVMIDRPKHYTKVYLLVVES